MYDFYLKALDFYSNINLSGELTFVIIPPILDYPEQCIVIQHRY